MIKNQTKSTLDISSYAITPDDLIAQLRIESPRDRVTVKGIAEKLKPFSKEGETTQWVYGELRGVEGTIKFRCPATNTPTKEGEAVVLNGFIKIQTSKFHNGLDVILNGEMAGTWTPGVNQSNQIVRLERKNSRLPLSTFLRDYTLDSLCILASNRGKSDLLAAINKHDTNIHPHIVNCRFNSKKNLLLDFNTAMDNTEIKGIAFARGGSDDAIMHQWNDAELLAEILDKELPFYTAIGHSDVLLLADKYCDESFTTSTSLGDSLGQAITQIAKEQQQNKTLKSLYKERDQLRNEKVKLTEKQHQLKQTYFKRLLVAILVFLVLAAGLWLSLSREPENLKPVKPGKSRV